MHLTHNNFRYLPFLSGGSEDTVNFRKVWHSQAGIKRAPNSTIPVNSLRRTWLFPKSQPYAEL